MVDRDLILNKSQIIENKLSDLKYFIRQVLALLRMP